MRVLVLLGLVLGGLALVGTIYDEVNRRAERRARVRRATIDYAGASTAYSLGLRFAQLGYEFKKCDRGDASMIAGIAVCDSIKLKQERAAFEQSCSACSPKDAPSATCARIEWEMARGRPHDNPCERDP